MLIDVEAAVGEGGGGGHGLKGLGGMADGLGRLLGRQGVHLFVAGPVTWCAPDEEPGCVVLGGWRRRRRWWPSQCPAR